jgi:hypothetical protein
MYLTIQSPFENSKHCVFIPLTLLVLPAARSSLAISIRKVANNGVNSLSSRTHLIIQLMRFAKNTSDGGLTGEPLNTFFYRYVRI